MTNPNPIKVSALHGSILFAFATLGVGWLVTSSSWAQVPITKEEELKQKERKKDETKQPSRKESEQPKSPPTGTQPPAKGQEKEIKPPTAKDAIPQAPDRPPPVKALPSPGSQGPTAPKIVVPPPKGEQSAPQKNVPPLVPKQIGPQTQPDAGKSAQPSTPPNDAASPAPTGQPKSPPSSTPSQKDMKAPSAKDSQAPGGAPPPAPVTPATKDATPPAPTGQKALPQGSVPPAGPKQASPDGQPKQGSPSNIPGQPQIVPPKQSNVPAGQAIPSAPGTASVGNAVVPAPGPQTIDQVRQGRVQSVGASGQSVITEPGNRTIITQDNRVFITRNETTVIQNYAPNAQTTPKPNGVNETVYQRPDGARVFSEVDANGRLLRRYRQDQQGHEIVFIDNRKFYRNLAIGVGVGVAIGAVALALAPPVVTLPREKYIVEYDRASDDDVYEALVAPPIERLERTYSLEEVRYSEPLRARVRRVDLDTITFDFGSFAVSPEQFPRLERVARAIGRAIEKDPAEVFMIEGHTDAVGSVEDNLSLSDRRAEGVARILAQHFNIPIENLVTQGYGAQFLKIPTSEAERANRRVAVRRITPFLSREGPN